MSECLFCRIATGAIPADLIYESPSVVAFRDINPQAPTHVLIVPREHVSTVNELEAQHENLVGQLFSAARTIASDQGLAEPGYRLVMNCNEGAGQSVFHIHLHLLGGRQFGWPPG
jgi:histidine triad (HIT) family protein